MLKNVYHVRPQLSLLNKAPLNFGWHKFELMCFHTHCDPHNTTTVEVQPEFRRFAKVQRDVDVKHQLTSQRGFLRHRTIQCLVARWVYAWNISGNRIPTKIHRHGRCQTIPNEMCSYVQVYHVRPQLSCNSIKHPQIFAGTNSS